MTLLDLILEVSQLIGLFILAVTFWLSLWGIQTLTKKGITYLIELYKARSQQND